MSKPKAGTPSEDFYSDLGSFYPLVKLAWLEAEAFPERADEVFDELVERLRHVSRVTDLHLREAAKRAMAAEDRSIAYEQQFVTALQKAEARIAADLADLHVGTINDAFDPVGCFVYALWGTDPDCPLYIGKSGNVLARLGQHLGDRRKNPSISRVTLMRCRDARHMDDTERRLIRHYLPPWNIAGTYDASLA